MAKVFNRKLGYWVNARTPATQGGQVFTGAEFHAFLVWAKARGFHVYANKQFGGVNYNAHSSNSWHYFEDRDGYSLAADIGTYGDVNERQRIISELIPMLEKLGIAYNYAYKGDSPNHFDHIHVDVSEWGRRGGPAPLHGMYRTRKKMNPISVLGANGGSGKKPKKILAGRKYKNSPLTKVVQRIVGVKVDGIFGSNTERAVKRLQERYGLKADGIFGPRTAEANLQRHGTIKVGDNSSQVMLIQYIAGVNQDGIFGKNTEKAVKAMQQWAGLTPDGLFGPRSRAKLFR